MQFAILSTGIQIGWFYFNATSWTIEISSPVNLS